MNKVTSTSLRINTLHTVNPDLTKFKNRPHRALFFVNLIELEQDVPKSDWSPQSIKETMFKIGVIGHRNSSTLHTTLISQYVEGISCYVTYFYADPICR